MKKSMIFFLAATTTLAAQAQNVFEVPAKNPIEAYQKLFNKIPLEIANKFKKWTATPPPTPKVNNNSVPALNKAKQKLQQLNSDRPYFDNVFFPDGKSYWARVLEGDGQTCSCTFLQSNSKYKIKWGNPQSEVVASGGAYPVGTKVLELWLGYKSMVDASNYTNGSKDFIVVKFADGQSYIGVCEPYTSIKCIAIQFLHSNSKYLIDIDTQMILTSTGAYKPGETVQKMMFYNYL